MVGEELARRAEYHVMDRDENMTETVAEHRPSGGGHREERLAARPRAGPVRGRVRPYGFQGGLQWYRRPTSGAFDSELLIWIGRTLRRRQRSRASLAVIKGQP